MPQLLKADVQNKLVLPPEFYEGGPYELTAVPDRLDLQQRRCGRVHKMLNYWLWVLQGGAQAEDAAKAKSK